jgi:hypothetical protein
MLASAILIANGESAEVEVKLPALAARLSSSRPLRVMERQEECWRCSTPDVRSVS